MGKPLRALLVEDVEQDALLVVRQLKRSGFDVVFERVDTPEAMSAALEKQPEHVPAHILAHRFRRAAVGLGMRDLTLS